MIGYDEINPPKRFQTGQNKGNIYTTLSQPGDPPATPSRGLQIHLPLWASFQPFAHRPPPTDCKLVARAGETPEPDPSDPYAEDSRRGMGGC